MDTLDFSWLEGRNIESVDGDTHGSWTFRLSGGGVVRTETPWRLVVRGRISVTSSDHGHRFGLPAPVDSSARVLETLAASGIESVSTDPETGDLTLRFGNEVRLEVVSMSAGYECWAVIDPSGGSVIEYGGGKLSVCAG